MDRTETAELTVVCLIEDGDRLLLQNRTKKDWQGYALPGGHVDRPAVFYRLFLVGLLLLLLLRGGFLCWVYGSMEGIAHLAQVCNTLHN